MKTAMSSEQAIHHAVRAVQNRLILLCGLHGTAVGLLVLAAGYALWARMGDPRMGWLVVLAAAAGVTGALRRRTHGPSPAHRIDEVLHLKDRVASAAEFAGMEEREEIHELQIHDAAEWVTDLSPSRIAPWAWRRDLVLAGAAAAVFLVGQWPRGAGDALAGVPPVPAALIQEAARVEDQLNTLAEELAGDGEDDLMRTVEELKDLARRLIDPGSDVESGLQTLGRIRNELEEAVAGLNLAADEALLAALAETLQLAEPTRAAANALAKEELARAAHLLDQAATRAADPANQFPDQARALAHPLKTLARQASQAGSQELSDALQQMSEAIEAGDCQACSSALKQQADGARRTAVRRNLADALQSQLEQLAQARDRMTGAYCEACSTGEGPCESERAGACASQGMTSLAEGKDPTSADPSDVAGMGTHDEPFGAATDLDGTRVEEQVSGQIGLGPSEFTLELAPPSGQTASREYREVYATYRKFSEQALEQEPIPSGHRAVIQTYFESIRPRE